jgi:hypothetical protein
MSWVKNRLLERTSWDGIVCIGVGAAFILLGPLAKIAAYGAIAYGVWTLWKKEN